MLSPLTSAAVAIGLLCLAGCGSAKKNRSKLDEAMLDVSKSYQMEPGTAQWFFLGKQSNPKKIVVKFTSSGSPVSVLLFRAADVSNDSLTTIDSAKAFGGQTSTSDSFVVELPADTETRVVVRGATKATKVEVKISNY